VEAGSGNIENLLVTLRPGLTVQGTVRVEGQTTADLSDMRISLRLRDPAAEVNTVPITSAQVKSDGPFTLANAGSNLYDVRVRGLPDGFYVRSIRSGDDDVLINALDLSKGAAGTVHVTLSQGAGQLEGSVQNEKQQPAAGAIIALLPQERERRELTSYYKTATTVSRGSGTLVEATCIKRPGRRRSRKRSLISRTPYGPSASHN
jgi:hypothetical protein